MRRWIGILGIVTVVSGLYACEEKEHSKKGYSKPHLKVMSDPNEYERGMRPEDLEQETNELVTKDTDTIQTKESKKK